MREQTYLTRQLKKPNCVGKMQVLKEVMTTFKQAWRLRKNIKFRKPMETSKMLIRKQRLLGFMTKAYGHISIKVKSMALCAPTSQWNVDHSVMSILVKSLIHVLQKGDTTY